MINASDVQCPICMEPLPRMVTPRITKCGHIYCYPCVLQYLAYDRDPLRSWKRCPLCNDPVYKNELKSVAVLQSHYYKVGEKITFHLMIRSKGNTLVKDKALSTSQPVKLYTGRLPRQSEAEYRQTRLMISENAEVREALTRELGELENEKRVLISSQEFEKVPYFTEAIEILQKEVAKIDTPITEEPVVDFEEKKRRHNKKVALKNKK